MKIEVWYESSKTGQGWHWRFRSKGKITADAESFPSKGNAIRGAKSVVRAVVKQCYSQGPVVEFMHTERDGVTVITWS